MCTQVLWEAMKGSSRLGRWKRADTEKLLAAMSEAASLGIDTSDAEAVLCTKDPAEAETWKKAVAEALLKAKAEAEALLKAEAEAKMKAEAEAEALLKAEAEAKMKAEAEAEASLKAKADAAAAARAASLLPRARLLGLIVAFLTLWACQALLMHTTLERTRDAQSSAQARMDKLLSAKVDAEPMSSLVRMEASDDFKEASIHMLPAPATTGGLPMAVQLSSDVNSKWARRQNDLANMQLMEWKKLTAAAAVSADPGRAYIHAWKEFQLWVERKEQKLEAEAHQQLAALGVQPAKVDSQVGLRHAAAAELDMLQQQQNFWLNYTDRVHAHQKDMMLTQVSVDDRRAKAQLQRDAASRLGAWADEIGRVALSLALSVSLALHGGYVARVSRVRGAQERAQWLDVGTWLFRPVAHGIFQFARKNIMDALFGSSDELIGILALLTAVITPHVLLVFLNTLLNPASLLGFRPQMLPGEVVLLGQVGLSWVLGFFLSQALTVGYGDKFVLGGPLAEALSERHLAVSVLLFALLFSRGAMFVFSIMI